MVSILCLNEWFSLCYDRFSGLFSVRLLKLDKCVRVKCRTPASAVWYCCTCSTLKVLVQCARDMCSLELFFFNPIASSSILIAHNCDVVFMSIHITLCVSQFSRVLRSLQSAHFTFSKLQDGMNCIEMWLYISTGLQLDQVSYELSVPGDDVCSGYSTWTWLLCSV